MFGVALAASAARNVRTSMGTAAAGSARVLVLLEEHTLAPSVACNRPGRRQTALRLTAVAAPCICAGSALANLLLLLTTVWVTWDNFDEAGSRQKRNTVSVVKARVIITETFSLILCLLWSSAVVHVSCRRAAALHFEEICVSSLLADRRCVRDPTPSRCLGAFTSCTFR